MKCQTYPECKHEAVIFSMVKFGDDEISYYADCEDCYITPLNTDKETRLTEQEYIELVMESRL